VAVLGAAFKPDSDDIRDSPALDIAEAARRAGVVVTVYDPKAMKAARTVRPDLHYAETVDQACIDADVVLHLTEWERFREIDPAKLAVVVANPTIIDGRNRLDPTCGAQQPGSIAPSGDPQSEARSALDECCRRAK
jgi:UDPglucose 6-dehydrogenase